MILSRESFLAINKSLGETHVLTSPYYSKELMIFIFASEHTIAIVLLHQNCEGHEQPIAYLSKALRD